jgi:spoIIIJ-associated protein
MVSIEVEGKTPEEAIEKALDMLSASREKVKVEVLDEGSKGLFGMIGSKQAKVKATLLELEDDDSVPADSSPESFAPRTSHAGTKPPRPITSEELHDSPANDAIAMEVLEELLQRMGFTATITKEVENDKITLSIEAGEDSSILIGKRGKNLNGLQYIVNRISARKDENSKPVTIDIEGYRERRKDSLEAMAKRLAGKCKSSRRSVETDPLSAADRRLIHMALKDDPDVQTQSRGEGAYKNVVIKPKSRGGDRSGSARR